MSRHFYRLKRIRHSSWQNTHCKPRHTLRHTFPQYTHPEAPNEKKNSHNSPPRKTGAEKEKTSRWVVTARTNHFGAAPAHPTDMDASAGSSRGAASSGYRPPPSSSSPSSSPSSSSRASVPVSQSSTEPSGNRAKQQPPTASMSPRDVDAATKTHFAARPTLTLSSSDHAGRPQQVVVLEASVTSDATVTSSDRSSLSSASDEDEDEDALKDEYGAHSLLLDEVAVDAPRSAPGAHGDADGLLVKPMPKRLSVCPVDDLAVEEEKRLRRSRQQQATPKSGGQKKKKTPCADTDSLPTPPGAFHDAKYARSATAPSSPTSSMPGSPPPFARRNSSPAETPSSRPQLDSSKPVATSPRFATGGPNGGAMPTVTPLLRKDSMAIRQQYWSQLGFSLSRSDLEKSTGRARVRREGLRVRLNDAQADRGDVSSFFQFIRSWYDAHSGSEDAKENSDGNASADRQRRRSSLRSMSGHSKKGVRFHDEAELFYIPLHTDYSKRQRDCMWPSRREFITMVERNLDEVYDEMEREYEEQLAAEERENAAMLQEEMRQRAVEKAMAAAARKQREAEQRRAAASPPGSISATLAVPTLTLTQNEVEVVPRARSSHEIRFKYLRHLGINS